MVQPKKTQVEPATSSSKRDSMVALPKKDAVDQRSAGPNNGRGEGKSQNGGKAGFRTDSAISSSRALNERVLTPWVPDAGDELDGSLEKATSSGKWDQFAENERLFGVTTDYDENIYTTAIDKSHPQYKERMSAAERKAREIERSQPTTSHVAEERVMDFVGGADDRGGDEEDKYSGVRRQDFPPLGTRDNKYTPPAKRAPSGQATVTGAPVDPAIITAQVRGPLSKKSSSQKPDDTKTSAPPANKGVLTAETEAAAATEAKKQHPEAAVVKASDGKVAPASSGGKASELKPGDKAGASARPSATSSRNQSPKVKDQGPSAASTVEHDVLNSFRTFARGERRHAEKARTNKARADKEVKLHELRKFADSFKLSTPIPSDLISIIAKDPAKREEIQAKARQNAEEVAAKGKSEATAKDKDQPAKETLAKASEAGVTTEQKGSSGRASQPPHAGPLANMHGRHPGPRQPVTQYHSSQLRSERSSIVHLSGAQHRQGALSQRLRNHEAQKLSQPPPPHPHGPAQDLRAAPTGPSGSMDSYGRRVSGAHSQLSGGKLNPNSHEFRPSFASAFSPNGHPSASSSPRSAVNNTSGEPVGPAPPQGQLIRRKVKSIDVKKCLILSHVQTFQPPQGRNWDDNDGLRPAYDTLPTWRQLQDENEKPDSTMRLTFTQYFESRPFATSSGGTPNPTPSVPHMAHQHQLPFHLQSGAHSMGPRQSTHAHAMQSHNSQHAHPHHGQYSSGDEPQRMMHSSSSQGTFSSPRMAAQVPMAYGPGMPSPGPMPYNQPVMQHFGNPGVQPQGGQYRNYPGTTQFMQPQPAHMPSPMGMSQFVPGQPMPQMHMMPGMQQFVPGTPQPPVPVPNGYPSPRPAATAMAHQGSQQGQQMYGISPGAVPYGMQGYPTQPGGQMNNRGYGMGSGGPPVYGSSPQQHQPYGPGPHRGHNGGYGGKGYNHQNSGHHGQHANTPAGQPGPAGQQTRQVEAHEEAK